MPPSVRAASPAQFTAEYAAPFQPFARCAVRDLSRKRTIKVTHRDGAGLARLVAFADSLDGRFAYELALWRQPEDRILAELRVGPVSSLGNWKGEVERALERCKAEMRDEP